MDPIVLAATYAKGMTEADRIIVKARAAWAKMKIDYSK